MRIDLHDLRERDEPLSLEADFTEQELGISNHVSRLLRPARTHVTLTLSGECLHLAGRLSARLQLVCCRCLQAFSVNVEKGFELEYWPDPQVETEGEEFELEYADLSIGFYRNEEFDLSAAISEQIVLEIPMKPVCGEKCKGLCPHCGADLNLGDCGCRPARVDPRLATLLELKRKLENSSEN